eukprot:CAMPEP_0182927376 /NCGR_PEP_ID=MMETSP0105_2-20130417/13755_1 /TAXON_ID=81532 ORGANISM="Acanthoeca-like sp., Strain 10tr" /NCGR_SAMPLE_ID=MMETSP0105_2 /ASSEMBLY_ACC=CAM_ASM_000205 /LENGTH=284 /DNA_ID=CAMNT_0025065321 /DNA_START=38 /DNA_END=892 /DNA_ORIENTATION=+
MAAAPARPDFPLVGRMSKEPRLAGKVCVISGANRGFGQAIAIRFVEEGGKVVAFSRSGCDETLDYISKIEGLDKKVEDVAISLKCDISDQEKVAKMVADTVAKFGDEIHVLVNNAARFIFHSVEHGAPEDWDNACAVNIKGHALVTKAVLPHMKKAGGGSIVFQGSISSFLGQPDCATYAVMKAAITQMARNCAYDFAKYNIRCNSVCAGTIETPISQTERDEHGWSYDEWESLKTKDVMMKRVGHVREIANATLFYASSESSYCTGGHLMVDGGQTACTVMAD